MDCQSALNNASAELNILECEQAVFTSVRSPLGRGYRLVAASPGLTADEKRAIVQHAPSHGNLCDPGQSASGLASFALPSGRHCILTAWHGEMEHTGRGGHRVHTHALVCAAAGVARAGFDAPRISAAFRAGCDDSVPVVDAPLPRLELELSARGADEFAAAVLSGPADRFAALVAQIADAVLAERRVVVANAPELQRLVRSILALLPGAVRAKLTYSVGMKFSPARDFGLILTSLRREEVERVVDEYGYEVIDGKATPQTPAGPQAQWVTQAVRWLGNGLATELERTLAGFVQPNWADELKSLCAMANDLESVPKADLAGVDKISASHRPFVRRNDLQVALHLKLISAIAERREALTPKPVEQLPAAAPVAG